MKTKKIIYFLLLLLYFSISIEAQKPIKSSVLEGEWKLISILDELELYDYDVETKEFHKTNTFMSSISETQAKLFEEDLRRSAETSKLRLDKNGDYELILSNLDIEKGTWKSKAVKESQDGFIPDTLGILSLTNDNDKEPFEITVIVEGKQLFLSISMKSKQIFIFRIHFFYQYTN